jgi:hypothetical protein
MIEPLLSRPTAADVSSLQDLFTCIGATIEDSLIENGAVPGKDYTRLNLFELAQPFVLKMYKGNRVNFTCSWPRFED